MDVVPKRRPSAVADGPSSEQPARKAPRLDDMEGHTVERRAEVNLVEEDGKSCTHEVAWPPGQDGSPLPPSKSPLPSARDYPFKIDPFQQTAINCLETGAQHDAASLLFPRGVYACMWRCAHAPQPPCVRTVCVDDQSIIL